MKAVYFATSNWGKVQEAKVVLARFGIELKHVKQSKPEDQHKSVEEIASEGAQILANKLKKPIVVEDSGLFFDAYLGFPGTNSHLLFDQLGYKGMLKLLAGKKRGAEFKTAVGYCEPGKKPKLFVGVVRGKIPLRSVPPFHPMLPYDSIFVPEGYSKAFSITPHIKDKISARVRAFEKLGKYLQ